MHGLEVSGRAHIADLRTAVVHGIDHVGAGIDHQHLGIDPVLGEESLLCADKHRQMAEIVADHNVKFWQVRHGSSPLRRLSPPRKAGVTYLPTGDPISNAETLTSAARVSCHLFSALGLPQLGGVP